MYDNKFQSIYMPTANKFKITRHITLQPSTQDQLLQEIGLVCRKNKIKLKSGLKVELKLNTVQP